MKAELKNELKIQINKIVSETGADFFTAASKIQELAAKSGREDLIEMVGEIKFEKIEEIENA